jgi:hypothetical protein
MRQNTLERLIDERFVWEIEDRLNEAVEIQIDEELPDITNEIKDLHREEINEAIPKIIDKDLKAAIIIRKLLLLDELEDEVGKTLRQELRENILTESQEEKERTGEQR